ncbi:PilZ domain-containing protein [Proteinivorax hydrogeniformans]|uniref:PilZ domain-containing protein n=1 Tax=Proteinivorax hydrogeniformans TaxID=1826727 RepID=A0AAU8HNZ3_9FIRM
MEKRFFFRVNLSHEIEFVKLDSTTLSVTSSSLAGQLSDISGGGLSFYTKSNLEVGHLIEIALKTREDRLLLLSRVVRKEEREMADYYAVKFLHLDQKTETKLIRFINHLQKEQ